MDSTIDLQFVEYIVKSLVGNPDAVSIARTKALEIQPIIPVSIRNERNKILRNLSYMKLQFFTQQHSGQNRKVLFEAFDKNGMMEGYTDNYIRISTPYRKEWANKIVDWPI